MYLKPLFLECRICKLSNNSNEAQFGLQLISSKLNQFDFIVQLKLDKINHAELNQIRS